MRAFFRPTSTVFAAVFRPGSVDEVSFVDYSKSPHEVVVDHLRLRKAIDTLQCGVSKAVGVHWLQLSKSAKRTAHSVYWAALHGDLSLRLPEGRTRIIFHGVRKGDDLFVTKAALVSVTVSAEDSLTRKTEEYIFHTMANDNHRPTASSRGISVPAHADGSVSLANAEWQAIKHVFEVSRGGKISEKLLLARLDVILYKIASKTPWTKVATESMTKIDLCTAFRSWKISGRLDKVLAHLESTRSGALRHAA